MITRENMARKEVVAVLWALTLLGALSACQSTAQVTATPQPIRQEVLDSVLSPQTPTEIPRLAVLQNGETVGISNGESVSVGDDINVSISVDPYPPESSSAAVDLYLVTVDGQPITDAQIDADYAMALMDHGNLDAAYTNTGAGHYQTTLRFTMFGSWTVNTTIQLTGHSNALSLPIVLNVWK